MCLTLSKSSGVGRILYCIGWNWQEIFPDLNTIKDKGQVPEFAVSTVCSEVLKSKEALSNHINVRHFEPCPVCAMVFVGSVGKRSHIIMIKLHLKNLFA